VIYSRGVAISSLAQPMASSLASSGADYRGEGRGVRGGVGGAWASIREEEKEWRKTGGHGSLRVGVDCPFFSTSAPVVSLGLAPAMAVELGRFNTKSPPVPGPRGALVSLGPDDLATM